MKLRLLLLCSLIISASCAAGMKDKVVRNASEGRCDEAIAVFQKNAIQEKVWQKAKQIGGATASRAATGVVMVTETTLYTAPGIAVGVIVCSPIIALEVATRSRGDVSGQCVGVFGKASVAAFADKKEEWISSRIWKKTEPWRLESYDELSIMLRGVAQCYADRPTPDDLLTAERQLLSIRESMWDKLSDEEKKQVDLLLNDVQSRRNLAPKEPQTP